MFSATLQCGECLRAFPLKHKPATKSALCSRLHIPKDSFLAGWQIETFDYQDAYVFNIEAARDWLWDITNEYIIVVKDPKEKFRIEYIKFRKHPLYGSGFEDQNPFTIMLDEQSGLNKEYLHTLILEFISNIHESDKGLKILSPISCPQAVQRTK